MGESNVNVYLDTIVVPSSLFFTIGYHAYLWHQSRRRPILTSIGLNMVKRKCWMRELNEGDYKKGMLVVQTLRNTLMQSILTSTISTLIILSLAALTNNAFNAKDIYLLGSHESSRIMMLKYGLASIFLVASFLCSSMAVGFLVDANFLMNAIGIGMECSKSGVVLERGFMLAVVGNRALCIAFPLLLWMLGPLPVAFSSAALVWGLYALDFPAAHRLMPHSPQALNA
ncbi:hypothetical protein F511_06563 [Dorcoceras hygrometricum]|uniref:DUF599 domain-containing protein n=1 Tax=Dorcoceras hygrometricum TaxID=472368 RepID=A0A2Z7B7Y2_9LAMI|nr:hypothetical protein F511_06563 [Dorcoceras hygrometricum]